MVLMIFVGLYITGGGSIMAGSGSTSVLWAVGSAVIVAAIMYAMPRGGRRILSIGEAMDWVMRGSAGLVGVTFLIVLAFALGQVARELEVGPYVIGLRGPNVPTWWLPAAVVLIGSVVAFTPGSSCTTFARLAPIAVPPPDRLGSPAAPLL